MAHNVLIQCSNFLHGNLAHWETDNYHGSCMNTLKSGGTGFSYQFQQWELVDDCKDGWHGGTGEYLG